MHELKKGILLAIEGIDGSGKSTLAINLSSHLAHHFRVRLTKEPGGSQLGKQLRTILQEEKIPLDPRAEYLLFAADRAQHFSEVILPALQERSIIISDRLSDSSLVYQGYGRGLDRTMISEINRWAMDNIVPDLVFYLQIDPAIAWQRLQQRNESLSRFEKDYMQFTKKLVAGFEEIFAQRENVIYLSAVEPIELLAEHAFQATIAWIEKQKLSY